MSVEIAFMFAWQATVTLINYMGKKEYSSIRRPSFEETRPSYGRILWGRVVILLLPLCLVLYGLYHSLYYFFSISRMAGTIGEASAHTALTGNTNEMSGTQTDMTAMQDEIEHGTTPGDFIPSSGILFITDSIYLMILSVKHIVLSLAYLLYFVINSIL